jgi:hypothetical protein
VRRLAKDKIRKIKIFSRPRYHHFDFLFFLKSYLMKKFYQLCVILFISFSSPRLSAQTHPVLLSPSHLGALQTPGNTEWNTIKSFCTNNLNKIIDPGYAGWDWHDALMNYATAYQVLKTSDPSTADKYAKKALALMKVAARHHNYGGPQRDQYSFYDCYQFIGLGDGSTKNFTLPFSTQLAGAAIQVTKSSVTTTAFVYNKNKTALSDFQPILKISNTNNGGADYPSTDYQFLYKDGTDVFTLIWGTNHPANGTTYYVTQTSGAVSSAPSSAGFSVSGSTISFTAAPAAGLAVFVKMIDADYNQTGNLMGGLSAAQPDAGYQMRTFNPGLAYGIDLLYNYSGLTAALKTEFVNILNAQLTWYKQYGYESSGVNFGNYFIEGLVNATMYTAYGTDGINPSGQQYKNDTKSYLEDRIFKDLNTAFPGGYGPQGQYTEAVFTDIITLFSLYKDITGTDLLAQTEWTDNMIRASIHGTKPDRKTFYDGGDWDDYPAEPMTGMINTYLIHLPNNPMAPYARQYLKDLNYSPAPVGTTKDYKTDFPLSYMCKVSSPVYARSDWGTNAVWMSFSSDNMLNDHQHYDQGHFSIQRGADYLLINGGQYGALSTIYNNTLLFDDRGAGDISVYPPGQGGWGNTNKVTKYEAAKSYVYSQADFTSAYQSNFGTANSVTAAVRSVLYIRPGIVIVHDKANVKKANVKKIFNLNFSVAPSQNGNVYTETVGNSNLFFKSLLPNTPAAVIAPVTLPYNPQQPNERSFQVTKTGSLQDNFFYVFEATDKSQASMSNVTYADGASFESATTTIADTSWTAVFPKQTIIAAGTKMNYPFTTTGNHHDLITDVAPNKDFRITVTAGTQKLLDTVVKSSSEGILSYIYTSASQGIVFINEEAINASQASVTNILNGTEGGSNGSFTITLTNPTSAATTITFTLTGTATNGTDYNSITGTAVIPAGAITATVPVIVIDDNAAEQTETVVITLQSATNGVTVDNTSKTLNIVDNDPANNASQASVTNIVDGTEGGSNGSFTIALTNPTSAATTITFTLTGTATNGTDYNAITGTTVIPAGAITVTVPVIVIDDNVSEPAETIVITLQSATNGVTTDNAPQTLNIVDNDAVPQASVTNIINATEGGSNGSFTITLTNPSSVATTITFTITGTATNGTDYNTITATAVIPAGAVTVAVPVVTIDDTVTEPTETMIVTLQSATNGVTVDNTSKTLNIIDNDAVNNVSHASITNIINATEARRNGSFTISLTDPLSVATTVTFTLTGTATNGKDYNAITGTTTIPVRSLTVTVPVIVIDDNVPEPAETVIITLQSATNGVSIDNTQQALNIFDKIVPLPPPANTKNRFSVWSDDRKIIHVAFSFETPDNVNIVVCDLSGKVLSRQSKLIARGQTTVNVNSQQFSPGVYVVQVTMGGVMSGRKIFLR